MDTFERAFPKDALLETLLKRMQFSSPSLDAALYRITADILPAYGEHCRSRRGNQEIYRLEKSTWTYWDWGYGNEDKGTPVVKKEGSYPLPGAALLSQNHAFDLYWLSDNTLLRSENDVRHEIDAVNQSSALTTNTICKSRKMHIVPLNELSSHLTKQDLGLLLNEMLAEH
jgi:hypothetical protein